MPLVDVLQRFWDLVTANPVAFLSVSIAVATVSVAVTRFVDTGVLSALRERLGAAQDELARLRRGTDLQVGDRRGARGSPADERTSPEMPERAPRSASRVEKESSRERETNANRGEEEEDGGETQMVLDDEQEAVLQLFANVEEDTLGSYWIASKLGMHRQKALHICEHLEELDMLYDEDEWTDGDHHFSLAPGGRRYLVDWNLLD